MAASPTPASPVLPGAPGASTPERSARFPRRLPELALALVLVAALAYILREGRGNSFFYDEWSWIETRRSGLAAILDSYNQHEEILPLAVYQLLFHTIGIAHYRLYRLLAALGHLLLVAATFLFARRRVGLLAAVVVVPLAFFGAGWEFVLWGVNFGFTTSMALALLAMVWLEDDGRRPALGCGLLVLGTLFSESAVFFAAGIALELTLRDRGLRRAWVWGLPIALYGVWWLGFYRSYLPEHDLAAVPGFIASLAVHAAGGMFGAGPRVGAVVLAAIALLTISSVVRRGFSARLGALLVVLGAYWAAVGLARAQLGGAGASRYLYVGGLLLLLIVLEALRGVRVSLPVALATIALCAVSLIGNLQAFAPGEFELGTGSRITDAELGALTLIGRRAPPGLVLDPVWAPQVLAGEYFAAVAELHSTPADPPRALPRLPEPMRVAADQLLIRGGEVSVTAEASAPRRRSTPSAQLSGGGVSGAVSAGCLILVPRARGAAVTLALPAAGLWLRERSAGGQLRVRRFAAAFQQAPLASLPPRTGMLLRALRDPSPVRWRVQVTLPGELTVCEPAGRALSRG